MSAIAPLHVLLLVQSSSVWSMCLFEVWLLGSVRFLGLIIVSSLYLSES